MKTSVALLSIVWAISAHAQTIGVPQTAPYNPDAHTLLLDHFDGTTLGSANGTVSYTTGVFGRGAHVLDTAWISYNLGALAQGTIECWANLDNLTNSSGNVPGLIGSFYTPFYAGTGYILVDFMGQPRGGINIAPFSWNHAPESSTRIMANTWHNYALTWGSAGLRFYIDGDLVSSTPNTGGQNPSTGWWAVGVNGSSAIGSPGQGFNGTIDELRFSDIQREFTVVPEPSAAALFSLTATTLLLGGRRKYHQCGAV